MDWAPCRYWQCLHTVFPSPARCAALALSNVIASARVTLFTPDLTYFRETRSSDAGSYQLPYVAAGTYRLGVAALGYEYQERLITILDTPSAQDFTLSVETNGGRWTLVGNTEPELLHGTGSGSLLPSGA